MKHGKPAGFNVEFPAGSQTDEPSIFRHYGFCLGQEEKGE